jgi:nitroreductase
MDALELMLGRSSALRLTDPAPTTSELDVILASAMRAPDHGRLRPWHFLIVPRDQRERFGEVLVAALRRRDPDAPPELQQRERDKAMRAPVIVVATARVRQGHKIPVAEQRASAAAAAQNIMLTAHAQGYGAMWKTGAPAYDPAVKRALGLPDDDEIVGFLYLGTRTGGDSPLAPPPSAKDHVSVWQG